MINQNLKQHFRKDEIPFLNECNDLINRCRTEYRPLLTHFLNPRQQYLLQVMVNSDDNVMVQFNGGHPRAEMQRGLLYPDYFVPQVKDFQLSLVEVEYPIKFTSIHHSQILGTVLGTGIKRSVLGDILTDGRRWQFLIDTSMLDFVVDNVVRIGHTKVTLRPQPLDNVITPIDEWNDEFQTIQSLRLDNVISGGFNLSRHQSKELVQNERVRLNWGTFDRPDYEVDVHDVVSVRGFGRVMVNAIEGRSKRGKLKIDLSVLKK